MEPKFRGVYRCGIDGLENRYILRNANVDTGEWLKRATRYVAKYYGRESTVFKAFGQGKCGVSGCDNEAKHGACASNDGETVTVIPVCDTHVSQTLICLKPGLTYPYMVLRAPPFPKWDGETFAFPKAVNVAD